ncbi:MAG: amidohydrolase family protein [Bacteroidetes bacterium]|nr:amidohydrolase family protein [Bacteroidota bacterium]
MTRTDVRRLLPGLMLAAAFAAPARAQENVPVNGPHDRTEVATAFIHAVVHVSPERTLRDATVVVRGGRIVDVGARADVPKGAIVTDLHGLHIWPGLIEPFSDLGIPPLGRRGDEPPDGAHYWDRAIAAATDAAALYRPDEARAAKLRAEGFTTAVVQRMDGIARGTGCAVELAGRNARRDMLAPRASANFAFRKGTSPDEYPGSLMGSIALLRQALYDARWYAAEGHKAQSDVDLQALNDQLSLPLVFEADDREDVLRVARIGREFGLSFIVKGGGDEYARLGDILATGQPLIIPLALPAAYDVEDPFDALEVPLSDLKHWELAGSNAARIADGKGVFAFTTQGLKEADDMWEALRRMVRCGLDSATAIAALTTVPAKLFRLDDRIGRLEPGMRADLVISSAHLLDPKNIIHETWVAGERFVHKPYDGLDPRGTFDLNLRSSVLRLVVKGTADEPDAVVRRLAGDTASVKAAVTVNGPVVSLWFDGSRLGYGGPVRLNGTIHDRGGIWDGQGQLPGDEWIPWSAVKQRGNGGKERGTNGRPVLDSLWAAPLGEVWYPLNGYGKPMLTDSETVIFRHATVWTNGPEGILRDADVCLHRGRILAVGKGLDKAVLFPRSRGPVTEIDATGKHLTCGIIDEHAHIGIARGVNEGTQAVTSEVRIGDVIDPDDIDLYRALAGGVTAVQQLHGSANPIGGQSALIKLRWGRSAEAMRIAGAQGFIKFALGENVKRSHWGDGRRFPRTRMGVEQVFADAFLRAKDYAAAWKRYDERKPKDKAAAVPPRRDLELDALAEVLAGTRSITCHSYVQSEILMLIHLADSLGFKVNTFTHVLEGYKVARQLRAHGATASTFSDWWAYKYEVNDATPYNAAILTEQGVNTCINSDDPEMGRRLNQEAAKGMKYGGMRAEDAWKMVTLNPAKALHLDGRMGSVEAGKDADVVLWSADPLSIAARVELAFVDGVRCYDAQQDVKQHAVVQAERARIVAKMLAAKKAGAATRKVVAKERGHWTCETIGERP